MRRPRGEALPDQAGWPQPSLARTTMREVGWIRRARRALEDVEKVITGRTTDVVKTAAAVCFRWSGPPCVAIIPRRSLTTLVAEFRLTLCTRSQPSLHGCLSGAMAALVSLACCLSGNTK